MALLRESLSEDTVFSEVSEVEQEYWSSPENRYYQLREMMTQLDYKAIREDRLAEATRAVREKAWAEGRSEGEAKGWTKGKAEGIAEGEAKGELRGRQENGARHAAGRDVSGFRRALHPPFPRRGRGPEGELRELQSKIALAPLFGTG